MTMGELYRWSRVAACSCVAMLACSCTWLGQHAKDAREDQGAKLPPPLHLGAVHQVYPAQRFALLRIIGPMPRSGATLITHPADGSTARMGNLVVPQDSKPRNGMIVADIRSGTVISGDRVFLYRNIAPTETAEKRADGEAAADAQTDVEVELPQSQRAAGDTIPEPAGVEVTAPPATEPTVPAGTPSPAPRVPTLPDALPGYLDDIPDNIKEWE